MIQVDVQQYDSAFYALNLRAALGSAREVLPRLREHFTIRSVLDVGCGSGAWLAVWQELGAEILGLDGDYVLTASLAIPAERFVAHDLRRPIDLGRSFDLVECLEVAEHLPPAQAAGLIDSLTRHGELVLFSAAPPGQGGVLHVNERPYEYWRGLFAERGYSAIDLLRPRLAGLAQVRPWYRYNTFLYAHRSRLDGLGPEVTRHLVPPGQRLRDYSPLPYRLRKLLLRQLPISWVTRLMQWRKDATLRKLAGGPGLSR